MSSVSAVGHLVQGAQRRQDAAPVGLYNVSVLDHLVKDDVDSVQVEHDLKAEQLVKGTNNRREELLIMPVDLLDGWWEGWMRNG